MNRTKCETTYLKAPPAALARPITKLYITSLSTQDTNATTEDLFCCCLGFWSCPSRSLIRNRTCSHDFERPSVPDTLLCRCNSIARSSDTLLYWRERKLACPKQNFDDWPRHHFLKARLSWNQYLKWLLDSCYFGYRDSGWRQPMFSWRCLRRDEKSR